MGFLCRVDGSIAHCVLNAFVPFHSARAQYVLLPLSDHRRVSVIPGNSKVELTASLLVSK